MLPPGDGILLIDKPAGKTSHDVVAAVRRELPRGTRVGHAGTLDPFATGLLLVLVGRATRVQRWLTGLDKAYETVARLGALSTTGDPEGDVTVTGRVPPAGASLPTGTVRQRPPAFSAVKIGGQRAYRLARAGVEIEVPEREVTVREFVELWREERPVAAAPGPRAAFRIQCSSGTYVRSLIADLSDAYCLELRRTAIGPFRVEDADPARTVPLGEALAAVMGVVDLADEDARAAGHGRAVIDPRAAADPPGHVLLRDAAGPIAVAQPRDGLLKPVVGFRG
ncbi:MAG: tRNA pseudouridine(55) synthase TruB [Actinomycetota bacterium]|nr:tRNA pseudouridine(55) synthase TruB [Actinomycetota bacterium]